jgi:hypothetical protein
MPNASLLSFLGVSLEETKGVAAAAVDFIPTLSMAPQDKVMFLADKGMRGSMVDVYNEVQGPTFSEYAYTGDVFPDVIGYPLMGILGDVTVSGASAPFTHVGSVKNTVDGQPKSVTLTDYHAITTQARQFAGAQFHDVSLKFGAETDVTCDVKATGLLSALGTKPVTSYSSVTAVPIQAAWRTAITIGGSSVTQVMDATVDLKRSPSAIHALDTTANPYAIWVGPLGVTGKMTILTESTETELLRYLNNTQPSLVIDLSQGAGATATQIKLQMSRVAYTVATVVRGKDYVAIDVTYEAQGNTTDAGASGGFSQIKATLQNAKASGTFA